MSAPAVRRALALLPTHATTAIGSLPYTGLEPALRTAFALDIPFLPQLPVGRPAEFMIPQALEGLPGLGFDESGRCTVDLAAWSAGREPSRHGWRRRCPRGSWSPSSPRRRRVSPGVPSWERWNVARSPSPRRSSPVPSR
ncbi:hypothetical protein ACN28S_40015 [Cystobacter fuscus]